MNNTRRKQIKEILKKVDDLQALAADIASMIEEVKDEEQDYMDNMPENLQGSERYSKAEEAVDALDTAQQYAEDLDIEEIISNLETAME